MPTQRFSILSLVCLFLSVFASHHEVPYGFTQHTWRRHDLQFELSIPTTQSNDIQTVALPERPIKQFLRPFSDVSQPLTTFPTEADVIAPLQFGDVSSADQWSAKLLVMAYYPDWLGKSFSPSQIDFMLFDWIDFAFAVPNENFELTWDEASAPQLLKELVSAAHGAGSKVKLSIGGWTGSKHFSSAVASNTNRKKFVKSVLTTYRSFELDGIDLDWEYPGKRGDSGNHFRASDSANFLLFLKLLRQTLPTTARISAAVETIPFVDNQGNAMVDVSEFAAVLDWVVIMNYDAWGSLSDPGPNAPLHDACNNSTQPSMNAVAAYNAWTAAQFPASKLVLGLPSYGYINPSTATHLRARSESPERIRKNDLNDDFVTVVSADGGPDHQVQFRELVQQGALVRSTSSSDSISRFVGNGGFERIWDSCSDTPYLRSIFSKQVITYDDTESLAMKVAFANEVGMLGINLFDIHGDSEQWDLTISVRRAIK